MIKSVAYCTSYVVSIILPQVHIIWVFVNDMLRVFTGTIEKLSVEILLSIEILLLIFFFELPEKYLKFGGRLKCHLCTSYKTRCRENMARWAIHFAKKHFFSFFFGTSAARDIENGCRRRRHRKWEYGPAFMRTSCVIFFNAELRNTREKRNTKYQQNIS